MSWRFRATATGAGTNADAAPNPVPTPSLPDKPSIAVLPFDNLSGDPEQAYFSDGMAEDIITVKLHNRKDETIKAFNYPRNRRLVNSQVRKANTFAQKMQEAGVAVFKLDVTKKSSDLKKNIIEGLDFVVDTFNNRLS